MTVYQSIPSAGVLEAFAPGFTHTSVTRRFGVMQRALGAWMEAEAGSGAFRQPDAGLRSLAARCRSRPGGSRGGAGCCSAIPLPNALEDRPLLRIARITRALALSEDGAEFAQLYARVTAPGALLRCPGRHPLALRVNLMLSEARRALAQLAALPDHALVIDGNCVEIMPEDVAVAETGFTVASDAYPQTMQAAPGV